MGGVFYLCTGVRASVCACAVRLVWFCVISAVCVLIAG